MSANSSTTGKPLPPVIFTDTMEASGNLNSNQAFQSFASAKSGGAPSSPMSPTKSSASLNKATSSASLKKSQSTLNQTQLQQQAMKPPPVTVSDLELENIRRIFNQFDADGSNSIDVEELSQVMTSLGVQMDENQLKQLVEQVTSEPDSYELSFDEFVSLITLWKEAAQYKLFEGTGFKSLAAQHVEQALESESIISDSVFKSCWDSCICLVAVAYWIVCLQLDAYTVDTITQSYNSQTSLGGLITGDVICTLILIADVIICSKTAFSRDGRTIDDKTEVLNNYKKSWMIPDILAALPLDLILNAAGATTAATILRHLRLLKLVKVPFLWKTSDVVPITSSYISFHFHLLPIFQLVVTFIVMVHGFTIGWILIKQDRCLDKLIEPNCIYPYTPAIYFVIYVLTGVGLGDIAVVGDTEQTYVCAVLIGAMLTNGIVVGKLVQILQRADIKKEQRSKIRETLAVLEHYHIATQLQTEILQFQAHVFENNLGAAYESIVSDLPAEMRTNISLFVRMKLVSVVPIFHQSHFMLRIAVAQALNNAVARPEQYMCVAGQKIDGLYFLAYGFADTFDLKGQYKQTLRSGDFFGDESLIGNGLLDESVKALTYCDMWILDSVTFESLLERFPKFRRTVELLRSIEEEKALILQQAAARRNNNNSNNNSGSNSRGVSPPNMAGRDSSSNQQLFELLAPQQGNNGDLGNGIGIVLTTGDEDENGDTTANRNKNQQNSNNNNDNDNSKNSSMTNIPVRKDDSDGNQMMNDSGFDAEEAITHQRVESAGKRRKSVVTFRSKEESICLDGTQQEGQQEENPISVRDVEKFLKQMRRFKSKLQNQS